MDDDLIVVDDFDNDAGPSTQNDAAYAPTRIRPRTVAERNINGADGGSGGPSGSSRLRSSSNVSTDANERSMRSSTLRSKPQPKLKLKLSDKAASQAPGMSFLGQYDRELDSDDDDLAFEEQFILRMPPGEDCEKLKKAVASREVGNDIWFKFKDSRRAVFHIGNNSYSAKLVDLPCVIESQKTLDNKQMFKVADICQMLVVDKKIPSEDQLQKDKGFNIDEFIWPHGLTPPLRHVRKRRFRKRVNRRTIESVEQEVERLLDEDSYGNVLENVNPDLSDSELIEQEAPLDAPTPAVSDLGDGQTPGDLGEGDEEDDGEAGSVDGDEEEAEGDIDEDLAAELNLALENEDDGDDEDEEDDDESEDDESEDDDDEENQARKLLSEEIRDLEAAVSKKRNEIASSANPLIRKRFEDALKKLTVDLEMKSAQRDELKERQRMKKEGIPIEAVEDTDPDNAGHGPDGGGDDGDGLFGDDSEMDMN
ncbi:LOW QUALITY PROTEIN: hypothetical protein CVT25_006497 [Psilocybe cyanescens]|uniref:TAFII55 protein conserved region domain-containing protein n=1 Tax=Psilocybe cyanescens TaxID=93625 RepID=A0A409XEF4_PSICY|nr:LOW QUALITY PROTEIN: hypothetical protein CVT25_006497 [Psilocybe cyanescens]